MGDSFNFRRWVLAYEPVLSTTICPAHMPDMPQKNPAGSRCQTRLLAEDNAATISCPGKGGSEIAEGEGKGRLTNPSRDVSGARCSTTRRSACPARPGTKRSAFAGEHSAAIFYNRCHYMPVAR